MSSHVSQGFTIIRGLIYSAAFVWLWTLIAMGVRSFDVDIPLLLPLWARRLGLMVAAAGAVAGASIATFVTLGRGRPAPFNPPRHSSLLAGTVTCAIQCM